MRKRKQEYEKQKPYKKRKYTPPIRTVMPASTETKYFDSAIALTNIAGSGAIVWDGTEVDPTTINCLFAPGQGSDINQRIGRRVSVKSLKLNITLVFPAVDDVATARAANRGRIIVYQDCQTNGAQSQGEELMASSAATTTGVLGELHFMSLANLGRFKVLHDQRWNLQDPNFASTQTANTYDGNGRAMALKIRKKWPAGQVVNFTGSGSTVASIVDNSFHILAFQGNNALGTQITYVARTSFKDA